MSSRPGPSRDPHPQRSGSSLRPPAPGGLGRPMSSAPVTGADQQADSAAAPIAGSKKKKHRGGKKHRKNRRQSFATSDLTDNTEDQAPRPSLMDMPEIPEGPTNFYRLGQQGARSNSSLDSDALLDHRYDSANTAQKESKVELCSHANNFPTSREHATPRFRRKSIQPGSRPLIRTGNSQTNAASMPDPQFRSALSRAQGVSDSENVNERTPMISPSQNRPRLGYLGESTGASRPASRPRRKSNASSRSSNPGLKLSMPSPDYDINNPPSVPNSPTGLEYNDVMLTGELTHTRSNDSCKSPGTKSQDAVIDIDDDNVLGEYGGSPPKEGFEHRRKTTTNEAENDVCFPVEGISEMAEEDYQAPDRGTPRHRHRRKRWPDYSVLEEWAQAEKEERTMEGIRSKRMSEPMMVNGRLRPKTQVWHREAEEAPYRWTYFNEEFDNTIHSQTLSELTSHGQTFEQLFTPEPPLLDESSDEDEPDSHSSPQRSGERSTGLNTGEVSQAGTRQSSIIGDRRKEKQTASGDNSGQMTPRNDGQHHEKQNRYGPRPVFWLDVLRPTEEEMKCLARTFGIHSLTVEDIVAQEAREKIEIFRNYYFINFRSFEQDKDSEDYLEPVNIYVIVFNEGVLSFHFSMTPHPANVRRRIRQLREFMIVDSQWIAYGIIDDITDAYVPLITSIEHEVDDIDDAILDMHSADRKTVEPKHKAKSSTFAKTRRFFSSCFRSNGYQPLRDDDEDDSDEHQKEKKSEAGDRTSGDGTGHMLRRVGETRKKVMELYRLLVNKGDVIKTLAKRCNEQWQVAPRSEIGMYLGDIQDHIVTMTGNLSHYENLLSRAHSNYLAQINIRMNERGEETADVLGKLTVLGTIVLPMNIVTGMWGMNVKVPGQESGDLIWFWWIAAGLFVFGFACFYYCKRVYKIV